MPKLRRKFTSEEDKLLRAQYGKAPITRLMYKLRTSNQIIDRRAKELDLPQRALTRRRKGNELIIPEGLVEEKRASVPEPNIVRSSFIAPISLSRLMAGR